MNRYEQAIEGLAIHRGVSSEVPALGVVLVNDGDSRWLADSRAWVAAVAVLEAQPEIADEGGGEGGMEAYSALCEEVRRASRHLGTAMVSIHVTDVGDVAAQRALVAAAMDAGLPTTEWMESMVEAE